MQRAPALLPGSRVRVIAPASPFDQARFERGLARLAELELEPDLAPHLHERAGSLAGEDDDRASDLIAALEDPSVSAIWCARGGYGTTRLLHRLSQVMPSGPKLLIGFSDISALLALWFTRYDMAAIHGPVLTSLADEPDDSMAHLRRLLRGEATGLRLPLAESPAVGPIQGTLFACNLTLLATLIGTPYLPDLGRCLLAVEEVGERPYRLDRLWTQIRQAGLLTGVEAIVLGDFHGCDEPDGSLVARDGLDRGLAGVSLPVFRGLQIGHRAPNYALPVGTRARIADGSLELLEEVVAPPLA